MSNINIGNLIAFVIIVLAILGIVVLVATSGEGESRLEKNQREAIERNSATIQECRDRGGLPIMGGYGDIRRCDGI